MSSHDVQQTRRRVLKRAGGAVAGLAVAAGAAAADHSHPDVETVAAESFSSDSACLDGDLNSFGEGADSAEVFFEWDYASDSDFSFETTHQTMTSTGSFDEHLDGLESDTEYKVRAVAVAEDGDSDRGDTLTFTTNSDGTFG